MTSMDEHASDLKLDALALGLPGADAVRAHVESCPRCGDRLRKLETERRAAPLSPEFARRRERLSVRKRSAAWFALPAFALAAVAAFAVLPSLLPGVADGPRLKGSPSVELVDASGRPIHEAKVGDELTLTVGGAGLPYAAVFGVEETGEVVRLWDGALPSGKLAQVSRFTVTPGSIAVVAIYSDRPVELEEAERQVREAARGAQAPFDLTLPAGIRSARAALKVRP